ncbi:MAG: leucine-rich repeat domain-containing protein [Bacteroidaceae bacterium]|nr:leucine-rich repeat domain-containing protein [Bacteroidaceae bacterium]
MKHARHFFLALAALLCGLTASAHDFVVGGIYYNLPAQLDLADPVVSVTYMGDDYYEFKNEYRGHITIPSSVVYRGTRFRVGEIESHAFEDCNALTSVVISNGIESIGLEAFRDCSGLTSITIPRSVEYFGYAAFANCMSLSDVHISSIADWCDNHFGAYVNPVYAFKSNEEFAASNPLYYAKRLYVNGQRVTQLVIPETVNMIKDWSFAGCNCLTSISIPESVTSIGNNAFYKCPARRKPIDYSVRVGDFKFLDGALVGYIGSSTNVVLPKNFQGKKYAIGERAFKDSKIVSVTIPEGVTDIGSSAFWGCTKLASITIPESVTSIGLGAFSGCSSLTSITIPQGVMSFGSSVFSGCSSLTSITIPENVMSIRDWAFYGCSSLTSVTLPESLTSIGDYAFSGCSSLSSINIPESVTSIGLGAFFGCAKLTSAKCPVRFRNLFPKVDFSVRVGDFKFLNDTLVGYLGSSNNVVLPQDFQGEKYAIGDNAFKNSAITSITIPQGVTSIGNHAFSDCKNLISITIPQGVTSIGDYAFFGCAKLSSATIPESVANIGIGAFCLCSKLTSITIPESVTSIGDRAFRDCTSLTSITIPESVKSIGDYAFFGCAKLTSVTIPESVKSIGENAFFGCAKLTSAKCPVRFRNHFPKVDFSVRVGDFKFLDGVLVGYVGSSSNIVLPENFQGKEYTIGDNAFARSGVVSVVITVGVTSIGDNAFRDCYGLTSVFIPESVTSIGDDAFRGCINLTSITIPESVKNIGSYAFEGCSNLRKVKIHESWRSAIESRKENIFSHCPKVRIRYVK